MTKLIWKLMQRVTADSSCVTRDEHQALVAEVAKLKGELLQQSKTGTKRYLLDGEFDIETEVIHLHNEVEVLKADRGSTYVRWGRTTCPTNATAVYKGYTGGNWYTDIGGPANYVCLPSDPTWAKYLDGHQCNYITCLYQTSSNP